MSVTNKAKNAAEDAKGKAKEAVGKVTGNERMQAEGQVDQDSAHVKQAAERAKETAKNVGGEAKGKAKEVAGAVTDDNSLEAKGKAESVISKGKQHLNK